MPQTTAIAKPHAPKPSLMRMSENGDGAALWGYQTADDWETVIGTPDYFRLFVTGRGGLQRHDRIALTCSELSAVATYGEIVLDGVHAGGLVEHTVLSGPISGKATMQTCWQILDVEPGASLGDVETSYRTLSKKLHPDRGGSEEAFARLTTARNECREAMGAEAAA